MTEYHIFNSEQGLSAEFIAENGCVKLKKFCGMDLETQLGSRLDGLFSLNTNLGNVRWRDFVLAESNFTDTQAHMKYNVYDGKLSLETTWNLCQETGIWSRVDALTNNSAEQIQILKCMPKIAFTVGDYEVYSQKSAWCAESQGGWDSLKRGGMTLGCEGGRTCQGSTPFFGLRESGGDKMACFHIIPCGNWRAYVNTSPSGDAAYLPVIELGLSDENLNMAMPAGSVLRLPEILIQQVTGSKINLAAPALHRYLNKLKDNKKAPPVVYNTWYDRWDAIEISNLREQLAAAKEIGIHGKRGIGKVHIEAYRSPVMKYVHSKKPIRKQR